MHRPSILVVLVLAGCGGPETTGIAEADIAAPTPVRVEGLRVMSFNILHGAHGLDKVAAVIRAANPDVVHLQEVDVGAARSGFVDQAADLARRTGLVHHAFDSVLDLNPGQYGTAFLSRYPIEPVLRHVLPQGLHPRHLFVVDVDTYDGVRRIGGTHLSFVGQYQPGQVVSLLLTSQEAGVETVLGDFNFEPTSPLHGWMLFLFSDAWTSASAGHTFPATAPTRRIDYVFTQRNLIDAHVPTTVASDHLPVVVTVD